MLYNITENKIIDIDQISSIEIGNRSISFAENDAKKSVEIIIGMKSGVDKEFLICIYEVVRFIATINHFSQLKWQHKGYGFPTIYGSNEFKMIWLSNLMQDIQEVDFAKSTFKIKNSAHRYSMTTGCIVKE